MLRNSAFGFGLIRFDQANNSFLFLMVVLTGCST
jgi:hypothetical protein